MATLAEKISAVQSRIEDAKSKGDESAQATAEGQLATLREMESEGFVAQSDANTGASQARDEGRQSGSKSEREKQAKALGVEEKDLDAELERIAEERKAKQSEADQYKQERDAAVKRAEEAEGERDKHSSTLRQRDIDSSIQAAAQAEGYKGNLSHLLRAADHAKVEEKDDGFNAKPAIEALKTEEFPGFEKPSDPDDPPASQRTQTGETAADKFEKRQARRGVGARRAS